MIQLVRESSSACLRRAIVRPFLPKGLSFQEVPAPACCSFCDGGSAVADLHDAMAGYGCVLGKSYAHPEDGPADAAATDDEPTCCPDDGGDADEDEVHNDDGVGADSDNDDGDEDDDDDDEIIHV